MHLPVVVPYASSSLGCPADRRYCPPRRAVPVRRVCGCGRGIDYVSLVRVSSCELERFSGDELSFIADSQTRLHTQTDARARGSCGTMSAFLLRSFCACWLTFRVWGFSAPSGTDNTLPAFEFCFAAVFAQSCAPIGKQPVHAHPRLCQWNRAPASLHAACLDPAASRGLQKRALELAAPHMMRGALPGDRPRGGHTARIFGRLLRLLECS